MKIKVTFMLALLIVALIYMSATVKYDDIVGSASADNTKCEDGYTCYWSYHVDKPYQKDQCRHNENSQWKFYQPLRECGDGGDDKKPDPTDTPVVVVEQPTDTKVPALPTALPTATKQDPIFPTNTGVPAQKDPTATLQLVGNNPGNKPTPTPTCTPGPQQDPNDDCDMCEQLSTVAAAQATIAADVSKGD